MCGSAENVALAPAGAAHRLESRATPDAGAPEASCQAAASAGAPAVSSSASGIGEADMTTAEPELTTGAAAAPALVSAAVAPADDFDYLWQRRSDVRLRALMNRLYQQERQARFERREAYVKVASIVLSSVAFSKVASDRALQYLAAIVFAASMLSLVLGWGNKSRDAGRRQAEWAGLERDIEAAGERGFTEVQVAAWFARANEIEATEPAPNGLLLERAYRRACEILGVAPNDKVPAPAAWRPVLQLP
jgi:hypothetical protein